MAKPQKQVSAAQQKKIVDLYNQGYGLVAISKNLGHCGAVVRRVLVENGVEIRPVGRPCKEAEAEK